MNKTIFQQVNEKKSIHITNMNKTWGQCEVEGCDKHSRYQDHISLGQYCYIHWNWR